MYHIENDFAGVGAEICGFCTFVFLGMLQKGCGSVETCDDDNALGVPLKLDILDAHFDEHHAHFLDHVHVF